MRIFRTTIAGLLLSFGLSAAFAGGQSESTQATGPATDPTSLSGEIVFQHAADPWHIAYFEPIFEAFEASYPELNLELVELAGGGYEQLAQRVLLSSAAGDIPDAAQVGFSFLDTLARSGRAVALDPYMQADPMYDTEGMLPAMANLGVSDGQTYMVPLAMSTPVVYVNDDAFVAAGLDPDMPLRTWDDLVAASEALKATGVFGVYFAWEITGNWIFQTLLENAGARMATADNPVAFAGDDAVEAISFVQDLVEEELMPRVSDGVPLFLGGQLGMLVSSSAGLEVIRSMASFPFRLIPVPTQNGSQPRLPAGGAGVMMFAPEGPRRQATWEFLKFLAGDTASGFVGRNSGYLPANQRVLDELRAESAGDTNRLLLLDQAPSVVPWHSWPGGRGAEISNRINEATEAIIIGGADVGQTLSEAAREVEALLP